MKLDPTAQNQALLIEAIQGSTKGLGLILHSEGDSRLGWGNEAFFGLLGLDAESRVGAGMSDIWSLLGASATTLAAAARARSSWSGLLDLDGRRDIKVVLQPMGPHASALWIERLEDRGPSGDRAASVLSGVHEWPTQEDRSDFGGPKAFWRSVGAVWAVCSRNDLPVALAFASVEPGAQGGVHAGQEGEDRLRAGLGLAFRRASDVMGRLGANHYAIFIVGQDAEQVRERLVFLARQMPVGLSARLAVACGSPRQGSSTQAIKAQVKRLHDDMGSAGAGEVAFEVF
jgi:hypothetical protein